MGDKHNKRNKIQLSGHTHHTAASICFSEALLSIFIWWHKALLPTTLLQEHNINQEDKDLN